MNDVCWCVFLQGFLTKSGFVNPDRVQLIMQELGKMEDQIFKDRQEKELSFKARNKAKRRREKLEQNCQPKFVSGGQFAPMVRKNVNSTFYLELNFILMKTLFYLSIYSIL